jgi:hypothetical protein
MSPERSAASIAQALGSARRVGDEYVCTCPLADEHAHGDADPSLYLKDASNGAVLVHCRSRHSSEQDRVIVALKARGLWPSSNGARPASEQKSEDYVMVSPVSSSAPDPNGLASFLKGKIEEKGKSVRDCTRFDYCDGEERWLFSTLRFDTVEKDAEGNQKSGKEILPASLWLKRSKGKLVWRSKWPPAPRVLYGLEDLAKYPNKPALVVEGEVKCSRADGLKDFDYVPLAFSAGSKRVKESDFSPLATRRTHVWPDNDHPGFYAALQVAKAIRNEYLQCDSLLFHQQLRIVKPDPTWPVGHDIGDLIQEGWTAERLNEYIAANSVGIYEFKEYALSFSQSTTSFSQPNGKSAIPSNAPSLLENFTFDGDEPKSNSPNSPFSPLEITELRKWPTLDPKALYGPVGEMVRLIEPETECDSAALLIQCLVAIGNATGRVPCRLPDNSKHHLILFALVVGNSSKSRKGSSWTLVNDFCQLIDPNWTENCISSGLSSGEGMIWTVHDSVFKRDAIKVKGHVVGYQRIEVEENITDKRRLFVESEFVSVLKMALRDGNTLSDVMRKAYDTGNLRTEVKNNPARATGAHLSVIGHITLEELLRYFDSTEAANGFGNRFLFACAKRSKEIPIAKPIDRAKLQSLASALSANLQKVKDYQGELQFSEAAYAEWARLYHDISRERPGLLGSMLARAEAQVCRLAFVYALLDGLTYAEPQHLTAALSLWAYCEQSVEYIFGDRLGDPIADVILTGLRRCPAGLTRTQINALFARHLPAEQLHRALDVLLRSQLVERDPKPSHGPEIWRVAKRANSAKTANPLELETLSTPDENDENDENEKATTSCEQGVVREKGENGENEKLAKSCEQGANRENGENGENEGAETSAEDTERVESTQVAIAPSPSGCPSISTNEHAITDKARDAEIDRLAAADSACAYFTGSPEAGPCRRCGVRWDVHCK